MAGTRRGARSRGRGRGASRGNATPGPSSGASSRAASTAGSRVASRTGSRAASRASSTAGSRSSSRLSSRAKGKGKAVATESQNSEDDDEGEGPQEFPSNDVPDDGNNDYYDDDDEDEENASLASDDLDEIEVEMLLHGDDGAIQEFDTIDATDPGLGTASGADDGDAYESKATDSLYNIFQKKLLKGEIDLALIKKRGRTRMAPPRPAPRAVAIRMISKEWMTKKVKQCVTTNLLQVDEKLDKKKLIYQSFADHQQQLSDHFLRSFHKPDQDKDLFCARSAYTGEQLRLDPGPTSMSIEAVYPFGVAPSGELGYHVKSNIVPIESFLNLAKGNHSIMVLPLTAEMMRTSANTTISAEEKIERMQWLVNSATNLAILEREQKCQHKHKLRHAVWSQAYGKGKNMRPVLEQLRTGALINPAIKKQDIRDLLEASNPMYMIKGRFWARPKDDLDVATLQDNLFKIARKYSLTNEQFLTCCTIQTAGDWVFFPFTPLTRGTAEAFGWSWDILRDWLNTRLWYWVKKCDFWALVCGLQEKGLCAGKLLYWVGHIICRHLRKTIDKFKRAGRDISSPAVLSIAATQAIVDRRGLPIVPWRGHANSAAFCKSSEHGVVMHTGLANKSVTDPGFDPTDMDWDKCSTTIDCSITNNSDYNYHLSTRAHMDQVFQMIPFEHPLWDINQAFGNKIWGVPEAKPQTTRPPDKEYSSSILLDIEPWLDPTRSHELGCLFCDTPCQSIGELIRHYQNQHPRRSVESGDKASIDINQIDQAEYEECLTYWESYLVCPQGCNCGQPYSNTTNFLIHMRYYHFSNNIQQCPEEHCDETFTSPSVLQLHLFFKHDILEAAQSCQYCGKLFSGASAKSVCNRHQKEAHNHECNNCTLKFLTQIDLHAHIVMEYPDSEEAEAIHRGKKDFRPARCTKCGVVVSIRKLSNHLATHGEVKLECLLCQETGSRPKFSSRDAFKTHLQVQHKTVWCSACRCLFSQASGLDDHNRIWHRDLLEVTTVQDNASQDGPSNVSECGPSDAKTIDTSRIEDDPRDHPSCGVEGRWRRATKHGWIVNSKDGDKCMLCDKHLPKPRQHEYHLGVFHPICTVDGCQFRCTHKKDIGKHLESHSRCDTCSKIFVDDVVRGLHQCGEIPPWEKRPTPADIQAEIDAIPERMTPFRPRISMTQQGQAVGSVPSSSTSQGLQTRGAGNTGEASSHATPPRPHRRKRSRTSENWEDESQDVLSPPAKTPDKPRKTSLAEVALPLRPTPSPQ